VKEKIIEDKPGIRLYDTQNLLLKTIEDIPE